MKKPWEWEENDLQEHINLRIQENLMLDYKACGALTKNRNEVIKDVSKDVSAFANSAGGVIIYGMLEKGNIPTGLDDGLDPKYVSREWLEQIINSNIQRRIDGVRIKQIELSGIRSGKVVYVVYIPQSLQAPHQASDKRFYKRFEYQSTPMEEYEIRDVSHRLKSPDLNLDVFMYGSGDLVKNSFMSKNPSIELQGIISNLSEVSCDYAVISILIDDRISVASYNGYINYPTFMPFGDKYLNVKRLELNWSIPRKMPIFIGHPQQIIEYRDFIKLEFPKSALVNDEQYILMTNIKAPGMQQKNKYSIIEVKKGVVEIRELENENEYFSIKNLPLDDHK